MTNVDIIKMCNNVAKEFPFTLSEVYGFMAYLLVKNEEYCHKMLLEQYRRL